MNDHVRNLIIIRTGAETRKGTVTRWAKVTLKKLAKIIDECVHLGRILVISGPDKAGVMSSEIIRNELERLDALGKNPILNFKVLSEENEFLGKDYDFRGDDDEDEAYQFRHHLSKQIVDLVGKRSVEQFLETVILVTHSFQALVVQERYAHIILGDDARHSHGGVAPGSGIWMHKLRTTAMTVPLHDKLHCQYLKAR